MQKILSSLSRLWVATLLFAGLMARAHDAGLSTATVHWHEGRLDAVLTFAVKDAEQLIALDTNGDGQVSRPEFTERQSRLGQFVAGEFQATLSGKLLKSERVTCLLDENNNVEVALHFQPVAAGPLTVRSRLLGSLASGHRQLLSVRDAKENTLAQRLIHGKDDGLTVNLPAKASASSPAAQTSSAEFVALGVKHIWTGYDHLLFLLALLVVTRGFGEALKIITCFTLAHSITLAVATFNFISLPSRLVEPLIAASIVYVGLENLLRRGEPKGRWLLTFAFGLIHGFGFASVLREMGVGANGAGVAGPLFSFNLGVELGQLVVAAVVLPLIWWLRERPIFITRWAPACSVAVALAGGFWFAHRVLGF